MILDALQLLAANCLFLLAGVGVVRLAGGWRGAGDLPGLGLAYVAGVAAVGVIAPLMLMAGLALTIPEIVALCASLFLLGFLGRRQLQGRERSRESPRAGWLFWVPVALVGVFFVLLAVNLWYQPLFAWDAWQHWTAKARSLVLLDGLDPGVFSSPSYSYWNPDYPLLLPALEAIDFRFMGFNTQILHLQFGLLLGGFLLAFFRLARPAVPSIVLWPCVLALIWAPSLLVQTASAYADVPLGIFFALAGVSAWRWLTAGDVLALRLLVLFGAASLATKMEGLVFVGALFLVLIALAARSSVARVRPTLLALAVALVGIVPWRIWTLVHDVEGVYSSRTLIENATNSTFLADNSGRFPHALAAVGFELVDPRSWLLLVPVAIVVAVLALRHAQRPDGALLVLGTGAAAVAGLALVYTFTPFDLNWHLDRSGWRVITGLVMYAAVMSPLLLAQALEPARDRAREMAPRRERAASASRLAGVGGGRS